MGRGGGGNFDQSGKGNRKSKGRMSYLRRFRTGGGDGASNAKEDEFGQKYGDYVPAYGSKQSSWRGGGGGKRRDHLKYGMRGFLCTTNFKENECVREAFNILNEYCEDAEGESAMDEGPKLESVPPTAMDDDQATTAACNVKQEKTDVNSENPAAACDKPSSTTKTKDDKEEEEDIDDALTNELKNLKSEKTVRKFQRVDTGVNNVVFISTTIDNPTELAHRIFDDVSTKKQSKSRHLLRLLPIELTCNANNIEEVKAKAQEVVERHMKTGYLSFRIVTNVRLNGKLKKDEFIKSLADLVSKVNPLSFVDLNNAQYTIVAEILKTTLCLGIVKDFVKFKKYNLLEAGSNLAPVQVSGKADVVEVADPGTEALDAEKTNNAKGAKIGESEAASAAAANVTTLDVSDNVDKVDANNVAELND